MRERELEIGGKEERWRGWQKEREGGKSEYVFVRER